MRAFASTTRMSATAAAAANRSASSPLFVRQRGAAGGRAFLLMVPHMHIEIRPTRPDHDAVTPLLAQLDAYLGELYPPEANHILDVQALLRPDVLFVAAWSGSEALGCGAVRRMPGEAPTRDQIYGEIKRMFVLPRARGARIGQRILESLEA